MKTLEVAQPNPKNPRKISKKKLRMLQNALMEFGDLSGIVVNVANNNQVVGGHQRRDVFLACDAKDIVIDRRYETPTKTGTVAEGYVQLGDEKFAYREVSWPEREREIAANIAANRGAGDWDMSGLIDMFGELSAAHVDLDSTMFGEDERVAFFESPAAVRADSAPESTAKPTTCPSCGHEFYGL